MQTIKFVENHNGYVKGQVLSVDENSAKSLLDRKLAEAYDADADASEEALPVSTGSNLQVAQVAAADMPVEAPKRSDRKDDLVAYAEGRLRGDDGELLTSDELKALTKDELADQLGLE